jgi:CDP-diacylglycerol--serine O-phosphatidyltransferase
VSDTPSISVAAVRGPKRRGVYLLPSFFTVGNLLSGYYAIWNVLKGADSSLDNAARAIGYAILFDALDGRLARATGTSTELGKQFDSLADVISFGVAPALLALSWGVSQVGANPPGGMLEIHRMGWLVAFAYLLCCAWRLARFNIQGMAPERSRYFVGLPAPAAAGVVAATVHAVKAPVTDWRLAVGWLLLVLLLSVLMASTVRYYGFKEIQWHRRHSSLALVVIGLLIAAIWLYSEPVLLAAATLYLASGPAARLGRVIRRRWLAPPHDGHTS